ncbi:MAG: hypothetical protein QHH15_00345 [Candidatus Thermoplasmatota archaeon]|nr:hypothetical protein [Candidatus Thermoplasmatota archaeon]
MMVKKEVKEKVCSDCLELKPIQSFDLTISGNRRESVCISCINNQFKPKKPPKIVGKGKPIAGFAHKDNGIIEVYDPIKEGKKHKERIRLQQTNVENLNKLREFMEKNGDGFTVGNLKKAKLFGEIHETSIYHILKKLIDTNKIFKSSGAVHRYFLNEDNLKYWNQMKSTNRDAAALTHNEKILKDIKNGNIELDTVKKPEPVKVKEVIKEPAPTKKPEPVKIQVSVAEAIDALIQLRIEKAIGTAIDQKINEAIKEVKEELDTNKIANEVLEIMKKRIYM